MEGWKGWRDGGMEGWKGGVCFIEWCGGDGGDGGDGGGTGKQVHDWLAAVTS